MPYEENLLWGKSFKSFPPASSIQWKQTEGGKTMAYEEMRVPAGEHRIVLEDREQLTISGVEEVESFDENTIVMLTNRGTLIVRGEELHIEKLSLDGGDLKVEGTIDSLTYEDSGRDRAGGLFARLFR